MSDVPHTLPQSLLTAPGVKATVADDDGWTPLQCARSYGHKEMEAQILGAGASDESSGEMKTPTQWYLDDRHAALSPCIGVRISLERMSTRFDTSKVEAEVADTTGLPMETQWEKGPWRVRGKPNGEGKNAGQH